MSCGPVQLQVAAVLVVLLFSEFVPEERIGCNGELFEHEQPEGSIFDSVGKFVVSVGDAVSSVAHGLDKVMEGVKTVEKVITDAIDEDCEYVCKNGAKPKANPYYKPESNGCGAQGYQIAKHELPVHQLTRCCDDHDICYDTCNEEKEDCDKQFKRCLYRMCDKHVDDSREMLKMKHCKTTAKLMFISTMAAGCTMYKDAQQKACYCEERHKRCDREL